MKNNKGTSIIEIVVSISLISIILTLLINLFINLRYTYMKSKKITEYKVFTNSVVNIISKDIDEYGLYKCEPIDCQPENNRLKLIYNKYRETRVSERIQKELKIEKKNNDYYLSYKYVIDNSNEDNKLTFLEKSQNFYKKIPESSIEPKINVEKSKNINYYKITIPIMNNTEKNDITILAEKIS